MAYFVGQRNKSKVYKLNLLYAHLTKEDSVDG